MEPTKEARLDEWICGLKFIRVRPGFEEKVIENFKVDTSSSRKYYKVFGHYDILELSMYDSIPTAESVMSPHLLQSVNHLCFPWASSNINSQKILNWVDESPLVLLVILKLHPTLIHQFGLSGEITVLEYLNSELSTYSPNIFTSLGHSEIVLFLKDASLSRLFSAITSIRDKATFKNVLSTTYGQNISSELINTPVFANTTSYPLVSYDIIDNSNYDQLKDDISPMVFVRCQPGSDNAIAASFSMSETDLSLECFGKDDILVRYSNPINLGKYTKTIVELRKNWLNKPGLYGTATVFLGSPEQPIMVDNKSSAANYNVKSIEIFPQVPDKCRESVNQLDFALKSDWLDSATKNVLWIFINRFMSCASDPYVNAEFADMMGFLPWIRTILENMDKNKPNSFLDKDLLLQALHEANEALCQRYAGIEAYLESIPLPPFSSTTGVNRVVLAAGDIPLFAINEALSPQRGGKKWPGFIEFSETFSYQNLPGEIIACPIDALLNPLESWITITHEISHIAFFILKFPSNLDAVIDDIQKRMRNSQGQHLSGKQAEATLFQSNKGTEATRHFISEMFAHWFDYRYFHESESIESFICLLWEGWIDIGPVWGQKSDYMFRSLLLYIFGHYDQFKACNDGDSRYKYIEKSYERLTTLLNSKIHQFNDFINDFKPSVKEILLIEVNYYSGLYRVFEEQYFKEDILNRLNLKYANLDHHVKMLLEGKVICSEVANPKVLLFSLFNEINKTGKKPKISTSIALILSLSYDYRQRQRKLIES